MLEAALTVQFLDKY